MRSFWLTVIGIVLVIITIMLLAYYYPPKEDVINCIQLKEMINDQPTYDDYSGSEYVSPDSLRGH